MPRDLIGSEIRDFSTEQTGAQSVTQSMTDVQQEEFLRQSREMVLIREQKARVAKREGELKGVLMDVLAAFGEPYGEEGQHRYIKFPKPIRGIAGFIRQKKTLNEIDETKCESIARQRGLYDRLYKPVMTLDESAVMVAHDEGLLTDADIEAMFPKKEQYAFVAEKAKKK